MKRAARQELQPTVGLQPIYSNLTGRELLKKPSPHSNSPACAFHWHSPTRSQRAKKPTDVVSLLAWSTVKDGEARRRQEGQECHNHEK